MDRLCPVAQDGQTLPPALTLGEVLRTFLPSVAEQLPLGARPRRVLQLLAACGTAALGVNLFVCESCHKRHFAPRSCGDRHCPRCLAAKSLHWRQRQLASLLPLTYYHCVFTLPRQLHALVLLNPARLYPLLFECASQSLLQFGRQRLGGDLGITALLHTWGQQLNLHPHLHCIVTGGALSADGTRFATPKQRKFLFPVRALAALFRGKFLAALKPLLHGPDPLRLPDARWKVRSYIQRCLGQLYQQRWQVYAKRPFGGPEQALRYLANYTHRVGLSNRRLLALDPHAQTLTFSWRDYRHGSTVQTLCLSAREFIRRFSWHILPAGLVRIRHYGILANNRRQRDVARARQLLQQRSRRHHCPPAPTPPPLPPRCCPHCQSPRVRWIGFLDARGYLHLCTAAFYDSS